MGRLWCMKEVVVVVMFVVGPVFTTLSITQHSFSALIMVSQGYFCIKTKLFVHHSLPWIISQLVKQML